MHIYFSGIGGAGISAVARLAHQAGFMVSGSDKQDGSYIHALRQIGVTNIRFDQSYESIKQAHETHPIDWYIYSSAVSMEQANPPEITFCKEHNIRISKRDEFLTLLITEKQQKLIAVAGTHGKSTTTAMVIWLFKELGLPVSYATGAKIPFGPLSDFNPASEYFVYECDEFDRNFLAFRPHISAITGLSWDHHELFPTREDYNQAFRDFFGQSERLVVWQHDLDYLGIQSNPTMHVVDRTEPAIAHITLPGTFMREDAWLAVQTVANVTGSPVGALLPHINRFPGLTQRMEQLAPNLYTNYAHTREKLDGGIDAALEIAAAQGNTGLVIIYEPLTNRRQHYIRSTYTDVFKDAKRVYWVPSYLAREDPTLPILTPAELITSLSNPEVAEPAELDDTLLKNIQTHLKQGDLVVAMGTSGKGSLDSWLREHFAKAPDATTTQQ